MINLIFKKYKSIIKNHLRIKNLDKQIYKKFLFKEFIFTVAYAKLENIKTSEILEIFYYFKIITSKKSYIAMFKKKYKEIDLVIKLNILEKNLDFFLLNMLSFFLPVLIKKENFTKLSILNFSFFNLILNNYSSYPFTSNIFFSWIKKKNLFIKFNRDSENINKLLLSYYKLNFIILK